MGHRAIQAILGQTWAMRQDALDNMLTIAAREHEFAGNLEALEQKLGRPLGSTAKTSIRGGVAIIPVAGPLFRYANLMTDYSGATAYGMLALDIRAAVEDPSVTAIVLNIDSPGGQVKGANELAKQIREARDVKPVVAYIDGDGASAAYWLASQASEIVADEAAVIGSLGVMAGITVADARPGAKTYSYVSSQSPLKNADPSTPEGNKEMQRLVDEQAQVFLGSVATGRGTTVENVLEQYGQGAVYTGAEALKRGMIDSIGSFEAVVERLSNGSKPAAFGGMKAGAPNMVIKNEAGAEVKLPDTLSAAWIAEQFPSVAQALRAEGVATVDVATAKAEGAAAERERINSIEALAMPGTEALVAQFKADGNMTAEKAAMELIKATKANGGAPAAPAAPAAGAAHIAGLKETEQALTPPAAGSGSDKQPTVEAAAVDAVALARKHLTDV